MMAEAEWKRIMIERGHVPRVSEHNADDIDIFVMDSDYHNGPGCTLCWDAWCMHCDKPDKAIEECIFKDRHYHLEGMVRIQQVKSGYIEYKTDSGLEFKIPIWGTGDRAYPAEIEAMNFKHEISKVFEKE